MPQAKAKALAALVLAAGALVGSRGALAQTCVPSAGSGPLCLTDTVTQNSSGTLVVTDPNPSEPVNSVTPTVSYGLSDQFNPGGVAENLTGATGNGGPWNFQDDYVFTLSAGSNVQGALISFSSGLVGISDLQARLIEISPLSPNTNAEYANNFAALNITNPPTGDGPTVVEDVWTTDELGASGYYTVTLNQQAFGAGTYVLQIRGEVAGSPASGSYGGSISFTPVPLPAGLTLLLSGLIGLGVLAGFRRRGADVRRLSFGRPAF
jgi:hypothetical protein